MEVGGGVGMNKNASVTETGDDDEQQVERPRRRRGRNESYIRGAMRGGAGLGGVSLQSCVSPTAQ